MRQDLVELLDGIRGRRIVHPKQTRHRRLAQGAGDGAISGDHEFFDQFVRIVARRAFEFGRPTEAIEFVASGEGIKVAVVPD